MLSINPNSRNVKAKLLKTDAAKNTGEPEKLEKTTGNNTGAGPMVMKSQPCYAIHNLHFNSSQEWECQIDSEADIEALQLIADNSNRVVRFKWRSKKGGGTVTPD